MTTTKQYGILNGITRLKFKFTIGRVSQKLGKRYISGSGELPSVYGHLDGTEQVVEPTLKQNKVVLFFVKLYYFINSKNLQKHKGRCRSSQSRAGGGQWVSISVWCVSPSLSIDIRHSKLGSDSEIYHHARSAVRGISSRRGNNG